jgi:hypothetical protein
MFALAALCVAAPVGGLLAGASSASQSARAGSARPVVAIVKSASGGHLSLKHKGGGKPSPLHTGSKVRYGDTVLAGRGARATFKVTVPKGDRGVNDLLLVKPVSRAHHTITLERTASKVLTVTLGR